MQSQLSQHCAARCSISCLKFRPYNVFGRCLLAREGPHYLKNSSKAFHFECQRKSPLNHKNFSKIALKVLCCAAAALNFYKIDPWSEIKLGCVTFCLTSLTNVLI